MKKSKLTLVAVVLSGSLLFSSCVGSFGLFNRLSSWNQGVGNKFVNELVFLAFNIVPVYGVAYLADALVINSIEFWSGSNPMANVGDVKKVKGENGNYMVKTLENGYSITKEGETASMDLIYNKEANTWNVVANGESSELLKMNNDGEPWFIDFQGGRKGPFYYDVASFLWQAKAKYPDSLRQELLKEYIDALPQRSEEHTSELQSH